ncbi:hypothetical protein IW967_03705 [Alicyclobacillus mali]|uniref:Uncharacterized protein n=1 Tax=Alicyclobacillus mali (ex Roth et al. 2021) TaxID=1123961 RepID=A0ABS0F151_9BACL|nr:hypothetical protein [Alicyclobacillus mali (ex Roth et al. 2021)]MBF8376981.1 hypothetical protein [Alicyclobacillus mali (ex Roth et al. 2021)]
MQRPVRVIWLVQQGDATAPCSAEIARLWARTSVALAHQRAESSAGGRTAEAGS